MPILAPRPHQEQAVDAVVGELARADRATAVMACGTGKTAVGLWAAEQVVGYDGTILLLYPSLSLIRQSLPTWIENQAWGAGFSAMAVCSDSTVVGEDEVDVRPEDLPIPVTTDPAAIERFLAEHPGGPRVLFATYQSAGAVAEAARAAGATFDLGVFDEAHRTAGRRDGTFSLALADSGIPIRKRLFMTATPKVLKRRRKDAASEGSISMDDEDIYGRTCYSLSFREAAERRIICGYRVLVSVVTSRELGVEAGETAVRLPDGSSVPLEDAAALVALSRAVGKVSATKVLSFHRTVADADGFADLARGGKVQRMLDGFRVDHVSGRQSAAVRAKALSGFRDAATALVTNSRCLTEGVDVPEIDLVAFLNRKESVVDIVQAVGRALRMPPGGDKQLGYVLVPLLVDQAAGETVDEAVARAGLDTLWNVLEALMDEDELLAETVARARSEGGVGHGALDEFVEVVGTVDVAAVQRSIEVAAVAEFGEMPEARARLGAARMMDWLERDEPLPDGTNTFSSMVRGYLRAAVRERLGEAMDWRDRQSLRRFAHLISGEERAALARKREADPVADEATILLLSWLEGSPLKHEARPVLEAARAFLKGAAATLAGQEITDRPTRTQFARFRGRVSEPEMQALVAKRQSEADPLGEASAKRLLSWFAGDGELPLRGDPELQTVRVYMTAARKLHQGIELTPNDRAAVARLASWIPEEDAPRFFAKKEAESTDDVADEAASSLRSWLERDVPLPKGDTLVGRTISIYLNALEAQRAGENLYDAQKNVLVRLVSRVPTDQAAALLEKRSAQDPVLAVTKAAARAMLAWLHEDAPLPSSKSEAVGKVAGRYLLAAAAVCGREELDSRRKAELRRFDGVIDRETMLRLVEKRAAARAEALAAVASPASRKAAAEILAELGVEASGPGAATRDQLHQLVGCLSAQRRDALRARLLATQSATSDEQTGQEEHPAPGLR